MTMTHPLTLTPDLRGAVLAARGLARRGVEFAARGDGVLARRGEAVEVWPVGARRSLVALAEASGRLAEAALDSVLSRLRDEAPFAVHLGTLLASADGTVREFSGVLVRLLLVAADPERHAIRLASAGAEAPLVVGRTGDVVALGERGPALGLVSDGRWREAGPIRLAAGHLLLATTSGVGASPRGDGRTFGEDALPALLARRRGETPRAVVRDVLRAAAAFSAGEEASPRTAFALRI